jgi:hypothetical protein
VDVAGNRGHRTVWIRGPRTAERGPSLASGLPTRGAALRWEWSVLPGRHVRVTLHGAPGRLRDVRAGLEGDAAIARPATFHGGRWSAVLPLDGRAGPSTMRFTGSREDGTPWAERVRADLVPLGGKPDAWNAVTFTDASSGERFEWKLPPGGAFEPGWLFASPVAAPLSAGGGLVPRSAAWRLEPANLPLRKAATVRIIATHAGADARVGICQRDGGGWSWSGSRRDSAGAWSVDVSSLGSFALFADTLAPRATLLRPARRAPATPYPRWDLEARIVETGSGLDGAASYLIVDGDRVPTEWDVEQRRLRWRPRRMPAAGGHRVEIVTTDRAGNESRVASTFVLD